MGDVFGAAASVGSSIMNGLFGFATNAYNNVQAEKREEEARWENYHYNELAAQNADLRTRKLYMDLYSPAAQLEQIKAAGLSPSLFYGDAGGVSGQAGAQGAGASGISPQTFGVSPIDFSQIALNMANADLMHEQSETLKAKREPEIAKLLAEQGLTDAATSYTALQSEGQKLDNYLKAHTNDANIFEVAQNARKTAYEAEKTYQELRNAKVLADTNEELYETNVEKGKQELELLISSIKMKDQERQKLRNDVLKSFDEIAQAWKQIDINERQQVSYTDWLEQRIPQIEKQLEIDLSKLELENKRFVKDAIIESIRAVAVTGIAVSSFKGGAGSNQTPPLPKPDKLVRGGNAISKGVRHYKHVSIWEQ